MIDLNDSSGDELTGLSQEQLLKELILEIRLLREESTIRSDIQDVEKAVYTCGRFSLFG